MAIPLYLPIFSDFHPSVLRQLSELHIDNPSMSLVLLHIGKPDVDVPDTFASYEIVRQISIGGFSAVVLVHERVTGYEYARNIVTRESLAELGHLVVSSKRFVSSKTFVIRILCLVEYC
jgi:hypothetical protein